MVRDEYEQSVLEPCPRFRVADKLADRIIAVLYRTFAPPGDGMLILPSG